MSIKYVESKRASDGMDEANLQFDNGDLEALKNAMEQYNFIDEEKAIRFALYVLLKAEKNIVYVDEGEKRVALTPADQTVKPH